jgi:uncharacterized membrane protein
MIEFIGKLHPLLVHLPIGFLLLLGVLEWLTLQPQHRRLLPANRLILLLTIPVTAASAACGWLLAWDGKYDAHALFWHRWLGTSLVGATILLWVIRQRGWWTAYRRALAATLLLLVVASHFGGTLTHGKDFLAWPRRRQPSPAPARLEEWLDQPVYATVIQPLFTKYCVSCHGEQKQKGSLRMDTAEHLLAGGDSGSALNPPGATTSLMGKRLALPLDDDDHMPPDGKPQPSPAELKLIGWWLDSGAPTSTTRLRDLKPPVEILSALENFRLRPDSPEGAAN